jgi:hypothetical protein
VLEDVGEHDQVEPTLLVDAEALLDVADGA